MLPQAGAENFTVASVIARPPSAQRHLMAIYGFARLVDDVGDEAPGDRGALLDVVEPELDAGLRRARRAAASADAGAGGDRARLPAAARPVRAADRGQPHATRWSPATRRSTQLLDYCQLSAAPVGELVLHVFGAATPERIALSDRVCAGLQVVEHLQDIAEDHAAAASTCRGRTWSASAAARQDLASGRRPRSCGR